eukprot:1484690-Rhodomonas_salina.1
MDFKGGRGADLRLAVPCPLFAYASAMACPVLTHGGKAWKKVLNVVICKGRMRFEFAPPPETSPPISFSFQWLFATADRGTVLPPRPPSNCPPLIQIVISRTELGPIRPCYGFVHWISNSCIDFGFPGLDFGILASDFKCRRQGVHRAEEG